MTSLGLIPSPAECGDDATLGRDRRSSGGRKVRDHRGCGAQKLFQFWVTAVDNGIFSSYTPLHPQWSTFSRRSRSTSCADIFASKAIVISKAR